MRKLFPCHQSMVVLATSAAALAVLGLFAPSRAAPAANAPIVVAQAEKPSAQGTLNSIDVNKRKLNITHGPIAALNWPGMTMDFGLAPGGDASALKPGAKIIFTLSRGADGVYVIDAIKPAE